MKSTFLIIIVQKLFTVSCLLLETKLFLVQRVDTKWKKMIVYQEYNLVSFFGDVILRSHPATMQPEPSTCCPK